MGKLYTYHSPDLQCRFIKRRWRALGHAFRGVGFCCKREVHFQLQLAVAALVTGLGFGFALSKLEWALVVLCMVLVLALEAINTAIEHLCNAVEPDYHPGIKLVKDIAAGAVLLGAIGSCIVGGIVFLPKLFSLLH